MSGLEVANRSYDGSAVATVDHSGVIFSGKVSGDELTAASTSGVFDNKNIGTGKTVTLNGTVYGGSDVDNYSFVDQTTTTANIVAKEVTVSGIAVGDKVYDGNTTATVDFSGVAFDGIVSGDELTASGTTATFGNKNVGTDKTVALAGTTYGGTNSGNYSFTNQATAVANISRLDSVMWIGGAAGDWSDPANWAGGAIPDLANVAHVIIPNGVTPTFNSSVAGPVDIDSLTGGNFQIDSGTLNVAQDAALDEYTQNGGAFNVGGNMSATEFAQNGGSLGITGRLDVTNSFTQSPTGTIDVTGDVEINQSIGDLQVENLSGHNVNLNSPKGGVRLGDIDAAGTLAVTAGDGNVEQLPGKRIKVTGTSNFNATGDITLTNSDNDFVGPVNANGNNVAITDGHGGLILNDITTVGTFDATSTGGPIIQDASGTMTINGAATFNATDGSSPADIQLDGIDNDFRGVVNASGGHISIVDAGGGVLLGTIDASGQLGVLSNGGPIIQTPGGSVRVEGESSVTAQANGQPKKVILNNKSNHFGGKVNIDADTFELDDEDGKVALGRVRSSSMDSVLNQATSALARDTNTRYTTETNSGTGILNVVQRYGQKWMSQLAERLFGDRNNSVPAITEESVQKVDTDVFLNVANNTDEGTRGRN
ncbi:YDG domain-containing protein [Fuerstiella marisgermanici]|uniref:YDG domain-containing protein n=1 Tax=Fuerstiella marisgermanici TaxID=1891926 RepID=UPI0030846C13